MRPRWVRAVRFRHAATIARRAKAKPRPGWTNSNSSPTTTDSFALGLRPTSRFADLNGRCASGTQYLLPWRCPTGQPQREHRHGATGVECNLEQTAGASRPQTLQTLVETRHRDANQQDRHGPPTQWSGNQHQAQQRIFSEVGGPTNNDMQII